MYKYFQPNEKGLKDKYGDCTIRALCKTLNVRQQEIIHEAARKRISYLLGGAHSIGYKRNSRMYMINLWNGLKATFHCGSSYKDLNPKDFNKAVN